MASRLIWLNACKSTQLKTLATAIGINSSGTKPILTAQLQDQLPKSCFSGSANSKKAQLCSQNIVSIDMGIRNLAYCRLLVPQLKPAAKSGDLTGLDKPVVTEWTRIAVSQKSGVKSDAAQAIWKENFDPATYCQHAYDLVTTLLATQHPTHILIERQRFRSMGGSAVQEWTLRVNMFEAMIYAVLETLSKRGMWRGTVHAIAPAKVSKFWLGDREEIEGSGSKSAKAKTAKVDLVGKWLEGKGGFELEGQATELGEAYLRKRRVTKRVVVKEPELSEGKGKSDISVEIGKLDDLADCLMQGMAWIQWERNRRMIMEEGLKALDVLHKAS